MKHKINWLESMRKGASSSPSGVFYPSLWRFAALLIVFLASTVSMRATDVKFVLGDKLTDTNDGVTFAFDDKCNTVSASTSTIAHIKMPKANGTLTITVGSGKTITNVALQVLKGSTNNAIESIPYVSFDSQYTDIVYDTDGGLVATWTGNTQVVLKSNGNKDARFYSITVSYTDNGSSEIDDITFDAPGKPTITPATGTFTAMPAVTFANATATLPEGVAEEGYYTLDGTDPTTSQTAVKADGKAFTPSLPEGSDNVTVKYAVKRYQANKTSNFKWSDFAEAVYTINAKEKEVTNTVIALNSKEATTTGDDTNGYVSTKNSGNITVTYKGKNKPGSSSLNFITGDKVTITSDECIRKIGFTYSKNYTADNFTVSPETDGTSEYTKNKLTWTANTNASVKEITFTDKHGTNNKVQLSSVTVYYDGYNLPVAPVLNPTPGKDDVYLAIPEITLTPADNSALEGDIETLYTVDGSDPTTSTTVQKADAETKWTPSVTLATQTQTYTVKAVTKRVVDGNTLWSDVITRDFIYGIADPTINPSEENFDNTSAEANITIDHPQKDKGVKVRVAYYEGDKKNLTEADYQEVELPYSGLKLTKTTTVKMYAEYNGVKTDVITNVYIFLDANTTYIIPKDMADKISSGTTVEKAGITMTFGGINLGTDNGGFKQLSKGKIPELGYTRFVRSETIIQGNKDAAVETAASGDDKGKYVHPQTDAALHDKTFGLPAQGSFFKFEPDYNGTLAVFVEQQGAIDKSGDGGFTPEYVKKRPVYFVDEAGNSVEAMYGYTTSRINKSDWQKTMSTESEAYNEWYTKDYIQTLKNYYDDIIKGKNASYTDINYAIGTDKKHSAIELGTDFQPIIVLHTQDSADKGLLKNDGVYGDEGDQNFDKTGYMLINEGYVTYKFPVQAGKTYFLFGWRTKLGICGFQFEKDENAKAADVTLDGSADNTETINGLTIGKQYNVTLQNRKFGKDKWYALVLPFSVSQKEMKKAFGDDVMTVHFDGIDGTDLNLFDHFYKMTVGGTPLLVKPSKDVEQDITFENVTLTTHEVQPIVKNGFKADGSWDNVDFPEYSYFIDAKTNTFYQYNPEKSEGAVKPHAGALRAWVIAAEGNPAEAKHLTMRINGIDDQQDTDGIKSALFGEAEAERVGLKGIYTISGQKLNAASAAALPKGMYIVNGKKLVIK